MKETITSPDKLFAITSAGQILQKALLISPPSDSCVCRENDLSEVVVLRA